MNEALIILNNNMLKMVIRKNMRNVLLILSIFAIILQNVECQTTPAKIKPTFLKLSEISDEYELGDREFKYFALELSSK